MKNFPLFLFCFLNTFILCGQIPEDINSYCQMEATSSSTEWIQEVRFGGMFNESGNNDGYVYWNNNFVANVTRLDSVSLELTPGFANPNAPQLEYWRVWIDFNQDDDFTDPNEFVYDSVFSYDETVLAKVFVPYSAELGLTRMRVMMKYVDIFNNQVPGPCDSFQYGEVEDYQINVLNVSNVAISPIEETSFEWSLNQNQLQLSAINPTFSIWKIYNAAGQLLENGRVSSENETINLANFSNGMYFLQLQGEGVAKSIQFPIFY